MPWSPTAPENGRKNDQNYPRKTAPSITQNQEVKMAKMTVLSVALTPLERQIWDRLAASQNIGPSTLARQVIEHTLMQAKLDGESQYELRQILSTATGVPARKGEDKGKRIELLLSADDIERLKDWQLVFKEPRVSRVVLKILKIVLQKPPVFSADELATMQKALSEMSRVGSNLNQFVRLLNILAQEPGRAGIQFDPAELIQKLEDMEQKNREFRSRARKILLTAVNAMK